MSICEDCVNEECFHHPVNKTYMLSGRTCPNKRTGPSRAELEAENARLQKGLQIGNYRLSVYHPSVDNSSKYMLWLEKYTGEGMAVEVFYIEGLLRSYFETNY